MPDFDVVVIGAGAAGEVLAGRTAAARRSRAERQARPYSRHCIRRLIPRMPSLI